MPYSFNSPIPIIRTEAEEQWKKSFNVTTPTSYSLEHIFLSYEPMKMIKKTIFCIWI